MPRKRSIAFWILGSVCIFFGVLMAAAVVGYQGISPEAIIAYIIAFVLIVVGGMFWIAVPTIHLPE